MRSFPWRILAEVQKKDTRLCTSCRERPNLLSVLRQLVSELRTWMWFMTTVHIKCCFPLRLCQLKFLKLNICYSNETKSRKSFVISWFKCA